MSNINMFCITLEPKHINFIKKLNYIPVVLGEKTPEEAQAWGHEELQKMVDKARR